MIYFYFLRTFSDFANNGTLILGLNRVQEDDEEYRHQTILHEEEMIVPVFISDPRKRNDVAMLLETLIAVVETRILLGEKI